MRSFSARRMARAAGIGPVPVSSSSGLSHERSSAALRLSEIVRSAMRTGLKARLSSIGIREIAGIGQARAVLAVGKARPLALRQRGAADRRLALLRFVHPIIAQHDADIRSEARRVGKE